MDNIVSAYLRARSDTEAQIEALLAKLELQFGIQTARVSIFRASEVGKGVKPIIAVVLKAEL